MNQTAAVSSSANAAAQAQAEQYQRNTVTPTPLEQAGSAVKVEKSQPAEGAPRAHSAAPQAAETSGPTWPTSSPAHPAAVPGRPPVPAQRPAMPNSGRSGSRPSLSRPQGSLQSPAGQRQSTPASQEKAELSRPSLQNGNWLPHPSSSHSQRTPADPHAVVMQRQHSASKSTGLPTSGMQARLSATPVAPKAGASEFRIPPAGEPGPAPAPQDADVAIAAGAVPVICNGNRGLYLMERSMMACTCETCSTAAKRAHVPYHELDVVFFEQHSGITSANHPGQPSIRMDNGHPQGGEPLQHWLERRGHRLRGVREDFQISASHHHPAPSASQSHQHHPLPHSQPLPSSSLIRPHYPSARPRPGRPSHHTLASQGSRGISSGGLGPPRNSTGHNGPLGPGATSLVSRPSGPLVEPTDSLPVINPAAATEKDDRFLQLPTATSDMKHKATPQLREGPRYQAMIPLWLALKPPGREQDDKRHGRLVTATEVLGVLPLEKIRADALPFDAVADAEFHRPDGLDPRQLLLERNQRRRQKPTWLQNSIDPKSVKELRTIAALRAAGPGGEEDMDTAPLLREESPVPAGLHAPGRRTPNPRAPGPAPPDPLPRKRAPGDAPEALERVPPSKRSRYYPATASRPAPGTLFAEHIHVPRRQRSGLNRSPGSGDFQMVDAVLPEPAKSPLHRRNRSTASVGGASGDAPGRPSAILRVTDATGGGSVRRRVSGMPNGVARGVSAGSPRELVARPYEEPPKIMGWEMLGDLLRLDVAFNGVNYVGALAYTSTPRIYRESARRPEQHATHSSPKVPSPPDTGSPAAGAGSRVGSEGPDRSSTLSMERRRRNQRDDDPEFVVGARAGSFRSRAKLAEEALAALPAEPGIAQDDRAVSLALPDAGPALPKTEEQAEPHLELQEATPDLGVPEGGSASPPEEAAPLPEPPIAHQEVQSARTKASTVDEEAAAMLAATSKPDRQVLARLEYERLKEEGAPANAKCTLCHCPEEPTDRAGAEAGQASLERQPSGLGPLLLVRVSAVSNAWVHAQCLFWSPDIYVEGGNLAGLADAVRRGRMIKCKTCGQKGATLGCHHKSCRLSYHLNCARRSNCLVQGCGDEPYAVACPKHTRVVIEELDLDVDVFPSYHEEADLEPASGSSDVWAREVFNLFFSMTLRRA